MAAQDPLLPPFLGIVETTLDALLIFEAARRGIIPRITRRLTDKERGMIRSGAVFVFDEGESGIKRWTDGLIWSPSRILSNFLVYRETEKRADRVLPKDKKPGKKVKPPMSCTPSPPTPTVGVPGLDHQHRSSWKASDGDLSTQFPPSTSILFGDDEDQKPDFSSGSGLPGVGPAPAIRPDQKTRERQLVGSLTTSYKFKPGGLVKKTMSVVVNNHAQHLVSYYSMDDALSGRLRAPSTLPELAALEISPDYLSNKHFRYPPKVETGPDGVLRYRGEPDEPDPSPPRHPLSPLALGAATAPPLASPTGSHHSWSGGAGSAGLPSARSGWPTHTQRPESPYAGAAGPVGQEWDSHHPHQSMAASSSSYSGYPQSPSLPHLSPHVAHALPPPGHSYGTGHALPRPIEARPSDHSPQMGPSQLSSSSSRSSYGSRSGRMYHPYESASSNNVSPRYGASYLQDRVSSDMSDRNGGGRSYSLNGHLASEEQRLEADPSHLSYQPEGGMVAARSSSSNGLVSPSEAPRQSYYSTSYPAPSDYPRSGQPSPHQAALPLPFYQPPPPSSHSYEHPPPSTYYYEHQQHARERTAPSPSSSYFHSSGSSSNPSNLSSSYDGGSSLSGSLRPRYASYSGSPASHPASHMYARRPTISADPYPASGLAQMPLYDQYRLLPHPPSASSHYNGNGNGVPSPSYPPSSLQHHHLPHQHLESRPQLDHDHQHHEHQHHQHQPQHQLQHLHLDGPVGGGGHGDRLPSGVVVDRDRSCSSNGLASRSPSPEPQAPQSYGWYAA